MNKFDLKIDYAVRIAKADCKDHWKFCIDGVWYYKMYFCDNSDLADINNTLEVEAEDISAWNSDETGYDKIVRLIESDETYLIKVS